MLDRPGPSAGPPAPSRRGSFVVSAAVAALGAAAGGLVVVTLLLLAVWVSDARAGSSAGEAVATSVQGWLLLHGTALDVPGGRLGLVPWGLTPLPALLLVRAGRHLAQDLEVRRLADAARVVLALAVAYGLVALLAAGFAGTAAVQPRLLSSALSAGALAAVCAGFGAVRAAGLGPTLVRLLPGRVQAVLAAGLGAAGVLLAAGALVVVLGLLVHAADVVEVARLLSPGVVGSIALTLLCVTLLPTSVVWGAAYLAGTGFAVGAGTDVSPFAVVLGPVPALPLLAAVPTSGLGALLPFALVVPLAAGATAAVLLQRRHAFPDLRSRALACAGAGVTAGTVLALLAALATGPVAGGRLAVVGPSAWQLGLAVALEVALVALAALSLARVAAVASAATTVASFARRTVPRRRAAGPPEA